MRPKIRVHLDGRGKAVVLFAAVAGAFLPSPEAKLGAFLLMIGALGILALQAKREAKPR